MGSLKFFLNLSHDLSGTHVGGKINFQLCVGFGEAVL